MRVNGGGGVAHGFERRTRSAHEPWRRDDCVRAAALGREAIRTQFAAPRAPRPQLARDDGKLPPTQSMWARAAATEVADP